MENTAKMPCLDDLTPADLIEKTIFIRVDFNVPLVNTSKGYRVADDTRIRRFVDTTFKKIHELTDGNCHIIIGSHLGRPHKKKDYMGWDGVFNIQFVCSHFDTLIRELYEDTYTIFPPEITDSHLKDSLNIIVNHRLPRGGIKFLPNLRYLLEPKNPDTYREEFMREVAKFSDVFINCAFGCSHRVTKSIQMLPQYMRQQGKIVVAGNLLNSEISRLSKFARKALDYPEKTAVIAGGAKIADKIGILKQFVDSRIRLIFIGGRMVNAFLLAKRFSSLVPTLKQDDLPAKLFVNKTPEEREDVLKEVHYADEIMKLAKANEVSIVFPDDYKITNDYFETEYVVKDEPDFESDFQLDLGPRTIENYARKILLEGQAGEIQNVFWNGPLGAYDHPQTGQYAEGSVKLAELLFSAAISNENMSVVIGGGDSAAILNKLDLEGVKYQVRGRIIQQLHKTINASMLSIGFNNVDTYNLCNYFSSNFFVSTGGGAALEFLEGYFKDRGASSSASYLPGTAILLELTSPPTDAETEAEAETPSLNLSQR